MATESVERKPMKHSQPPEPEHLPCPRCDSTNTKFCYYNNYNFSQPRHFCKSCRRYWTHGGTLRNIPIGGGSRKNAKRSRNGSVSSVSASSSSCSSSAAAVAHFGIPAEVASQFIVPFAADHTPCFRDTFTSLLNTQGAGMWALGGFGFGSRFGFEDMGFGHARGSWPITDVAAPAVFTTTSPAGVTSGPYTWQVEGGDGAFSGVGGDCFTLPELAISSTYCGSVCK